MKRMGPLDGLRAIAVIIVMLSHASLGHIIPGGFGVTIFFFLSGYLITTLMVKERNSTGDVNLKYFYIKRSVRILPSMMIAIACAVALSAFGWGAKMYFPGVFWDVLFLSNYSPFFGGGSKIAIPLWSLAIEEHFYLVFPVLFIIIRKNNNDFRVTQTCLFLCGIVLIIRLLHVALSGPVYGIYYWSHTRLDSILFGCILATWNNPVTDDKAYFGPELRWGMLGSALILATLVIRDPAFRETWRYTLQGIGLFFVFNYVLRSDGIVARILAGRPLRVVADLSYFLYLIHVPFLLAASKLPLPTVAQNTLGICLAFVLAAIVRHVVELPMLKLRKTYHGLRVIKAGPASNR